LNLKKTPASRASCKTGPAGLIIPQRGGKKKVRVAISGMVHFRQQHHSTRKMNAIRLNLIMQRWNGVQHEWLPELRNELGSLTPKLEKSSIP
jgi:hypothetical protein